MLLRAITALLAAAGVGIANAAPTLSTGGFQIRDSDGLQDIVSVPREPRIWSYAET